MKCQHGCAFISWYEICAQVEELKAVLLKVKSVVEYYEVPTGK
jgi:hypothetical protein